MAMQQKFEVGDLIQYKTWKKPRRVDNVCNNRENGNYFEVSGTYDTYYYRSYEDSDWINTSVVTEPTGMSKCKFIVVQDNGRLNEGKQFDKHEEAIDHASTQTQRLRKNHMVFSLTNIVKVKETPVIVETVSCG